MSGDSRSAARASELPTYLCSECGGAGRQRYSGCPGTFDPSCCGACESEDCWNCGGSGLDPQYEAFVAGIQLVTLGSRGAADEQWVRDSFEEWRHNGD